MHVIDSDGRRPAVYHEQAGRGLPDHRHDFPHGDAFRQDQLREGPISRGDISDATADKVLSTNPARLFHF